MINKSVLVSLLFIGMMVTMAGAGTWAAFSDKEVSEGNTITAGKLDLMVAGGGILDGNGEYVSVPTLITFDNVKPGWSDKRETTIGIKDELGASNAYVTLTFKDVKGTEDDQKTEPEWSCETELALSEADARAIEKIIECSVFVSYDGGEYVQVAGPTLLSELRNKKIDLSNGGVIGVGGAFEPGIDVIVKQEFRMLKGKEMVDHADTLAAYFNSHSEKYCQNWAQGDICTFSEVFRAKQTPALGDEGCGSDSCGDDHDHEETDTSIVL